MRAYAKAIAMIVATILAALVSALNDGGITATEWINVAIAAVTAASVFAAPNVPGARYTKAILAVLGAVLAALVSAISDGISASEWLNLALIALGALGVYTFKNDPAPVEQGVI